MMMKMQRMERNPDFVPGQRDVHLMEAPATRGRPREATDDRQRRMAKSGNRHTKRSPSERRFKCDQVGCERMFFTRKDVKRHMVVHTGVRNFACPFCQQRFGRKDHLVRHAKKSHNRDTRSCATSFAPSGNNNNNPGAASRKSAAVFKSNVVPQGVPASGGMMSPMFSHVPNTTTNSHVLPHPTAVHHHHHLNNLNYHHHGSNGSNESQLLLLSSSGSGGSSAANAYMTHMSGLNEAAQQFSSSLMNAAHHNDHNNGDGPSNQHSLTKVTTCDPSSHFFPFSVPPPASFVGHSLMPGCFSSSSPSRSLYSTPGPSHHHFAPPGHHGVVPGHHHHHPSDPSAFNPNHPILDFNPQLPNFNQTFQQ